MSFIFFFVFFFLFFFFFNATPTTEIYTLSLHDALPISRLDPRRRPSSRRGSCALETGLGRPGREPRRWWRGGWSWMRSEEHTSELQSHVNLVCRLLLEKKKKKNMRQPRIHTSQTTERHT